MGLSSFKFFGGSVKRFFRKGAFRPFKVIQFWYQWKVRMRLNNHPVLHRFRDIAGFCAQDSTPPLFYPNVGGVPVWPDLWCWGQPEHKS